MSTNSSSSREHQLNVQFWKFPTVSLSPDLRQTGSSVTKLSFNSQPHTEWVGVRCIQKLATYERPDVGVGRGLCGGSSGCPLVVDAGQCAGVRNDGEGLLGPFAPPMRPGQHLPLVLFQQSFSNFRGGARGGMAPSPLLALPCSP